MTESTQNPTPTPSEAEKIRADLMALLLKAAKTAQSAPAAAPAANAAPTEPPQAGGGNP